MVFKQKPILTLFILAALVALSSGISFPLIPIHNFSIADFDDIVINILSVSTDPNFVINFKI